MNTPQIEPITTMTKNHKSVLKKLDNGPVFLARRSRPAAVLLSVREYERMVNRLQKLELLAEAKRVSARIAAGREETISHDALKRHILARRTQEAARNVED